MSQLLLVQYGHIVEIDLKIPPRPPGYAFVEVRLLFSAHIWFNYVVKFVFGKILRCNKNMQCKVATGTLINKMHVNFSRSSFFLSVLAFHIYPV